jgi:hypothetical protein
MGTGNTGKQRPTLNEADPNIKNTDLLNLREYVTHDSGMANQADSTVLLMCTHSNLTARFMEIRFDRYVRPPSHDTHSHLTSLSFVKRQKIFPSSTFIRALPRHSSSPR